MKSLMIRSFSLSLSAASVVLLLASSSRASIIISEVDPSGSSSVSNSYNADWFELTNTGVSAVDITGWKMDDNSHGFATAVALRGVTSIAPGQSVVFAEGLADGSTDTTIDTNFENFWFGAGNVPAGFTIGNYGGAGVGLSQTADEVNIFDSAGNPVVGVGFGATLLGISLDNAVGVGGTNFLSDPIISTNSVVGVNGAFSSFGVGTAAQAGIHEVGSPGVVASVPEPASFVLAGMGLMTIGLVAGRRRSAA